MFKLCRLLMIFKEDLFWQSLELSISSFRRNFAVRNRTNCPKASFLKNNVIALLYPAVH